MRKILVAALALFVSASFSADSMAAGEFGTLKADSWSRVGKFSKGNGGRFDWTGITLGQENGATGSFPAEWSLSPSRSADGSVLYAFCLELNENVANNTTFFLESLENAPDDNNGIGPDIPMGSARAAQLELLTDNYFQQAIRDNGGTFDEEKREAAAFQLAVWEIVYGDGDGDVSNLAGPSGYDATDEANANALLATVGADGSSPTVSGVAGLRGIAMVFDGRQDQLIQVAVPEAASILAWSSVAGAVGLMLYRRRNVG